MYIFLLTRNSDCCSWFVAISDLYYTVYNKFNKFLPSTVLQQCCGGICISHDQSPGSGPSPPKPGPSPHDGPGLRYCEALARQSPAQARAFEPGPSPDITTTHRPSKAVRRRPTESCRRSRLQSPCSRTDSARKLARLLEPPALYRRVMLEKGKKCNGNSSM